MNPAMPIVSVIYISIAVRFSCIIFGILSLADSAKAFFDVNDEQPLMTQQLWASLEYRDQSWQHEDMVTQHLQSLRQQAEETISRLQGVGHWVILLISQRRSADVALAHAPSAFRSLNLSTTKRTERNEVTAGSGWRYDLKLLRHWASPLA